jgi:hypothetical protein
MKTLQAFRQRVKRMDKDGIARLAEELGVNGEVIATEDAIAVVGKGDGDGGGRMLAYAQPGGRFAGLMMYADRSEAVGEVLARKPSGSRAQRWAERFFEKHGLMPVATREDDVDTTLEFETTVPRAVVFDGRERKEVATRLDVAARISVNGIPVTGPRAKMRMGFRSADRPFAMHRGMWEKLEVFEERAAVSEDEAVRLALERVRDRGEGRAMQRLHNVRMAYWAKEYEGGAYLLEPWYFVEVEFEDRAAKAQGIDQGPRQVFTVPASR